MRLEHIALNVPDIQALIAWYVGHLGFTIIRGEQVAPFKTFLGTDDRGVMLELYSNPAAPIPDYVRQDPTVFHLGFVVSVARSEKFRLAEAGASFVSETTTRDGTILLMMRDPWGIPLQLCQRH